MKLASKPLNPAKFPLRGRRRGGFSPPPPAALRRTLTVTIIPVTFAQAEPPSEPLPRGVEGLDAGFVTIFFSSPKTTQFLQPYLMFGSHAKVLANITPPLPASKKGYLVVGELAAALQILEASGASSRPHGTSARKRRRRVGRSGG